MPVPTYICRNRHDAFCFRVVIPKDLRNHFPNRQREIWRTLGTHKRQDAIRLARVYAVAADSLFQGLREGVVSKTKPAFHDIKHLLIGSDGSIKLEGITINPATSEADTGVPRTIS